jgi:hypothetical protein
MEGQRPIPWAHEPNRGFLRCLHGSSQAAAEIGEADEADPCANSSATATLPPRRTRYFRPARTARHA